MAGSAPENDEEITGINVTPLVDIVLVLLIIFMVTANFIVRETVEVDLPRAANGGETVQGLVNVVMDKDVALVRRVCAAVFQPSPSFSTDLCRPPTRTGGGQPPNDIWGLQLP